MPGKWVSFQPLWVYFLKVYIVSCRHIKHYIKSSPKNIQSNLHNRQSLPKTPIVWFRPCLRPYFSKTKQPCLLKFTECLANRVVYKYCLQEEPHMSKGVIEIYVYTVLSLKLQICNKATVCSLRPLI